MSTRIYGNLKEKELRKIQQSDFSEENKSILTEFYNDYVLRGNNQDESTLSESRGNKLLYHLRHTIAKQKINLNKLNTKSCRQFMDWLRESKNSNWTKTDYVIALRLFIQWLTSKKHERRVANLPKRFLPSYYYELTRFRIHQQAISSNELLTPNEVIRLIDAGNSKRDKCFIALLWESAGRIGEIGDFCIKDISFDNQKDEKGEEIESVTLKVNGKTGERIIPLFESVPFIKAYLNEHHFKNNPEKPFFTNKKGTCISYNALRKILIQAAKKSGVRKKINPHNWRKARATYLVAHGLPEAKVKALCGWTPSSNMLDTYIHLGGNEVWAELAQMHGYAIDTKIETINQEINKCNKCKSVLVGDDLKKTIRLNSKGVSKYFWKLFYTIFK